MKHGQGRERKGEYKPRITRYVIKLIYIHDPAKITNITRDHIVAKWSKKTGLLWRIAPTYIYGKDDNDCYWLVRDGSKGAIESVIKSTGEYLAQGAMTQEHAEELLDMLYKELQARLAE